MNLKWKLTKGNLRLNIKKLLHVKPITEKPTRNNLVVVVSLVISCLRLEPADEGETRTSEFVSAIKGGNVPKEFIPSVEKGFKMAMVNGPLAGYRG